MKKLVLTLALILCGYAISQASILTKQSVELVVGSNPVGIVENPIDGMINIFCAGIDGNGNNEFDEGEDEKPSWWHYNPTGGSIEPTKIRDFENFFVSPFKPTVDTLNGYSMVVIPFAANKVGGEFTSNGFVRGLQMKSGAPAFKFEVTNGEYLTYKREEDLLITIVRNNGKDSLLTKSPSAEVSKSIELNGDANDFAYVDLDFDGETEIAILVDNKIMNFIQFRDVFVFEPIKEIPLDQNSFYTGSLGHLYSKGSQIYTTFPESNALVTVRIVENDENEVLASVYKDDGVIDFENIQSNYPLSDEYNIISNENFNLLVTGYTGIPEMHRTNTSTDFVYANETTVYITGKKKVFIYDIENEPNEDPNKVSKRFVGYQPLDIFSHEDIYTSINLGVDFNFDGTIDESVGEQTATADFFTLSDKGEIEIDDSKRFSFGFNINYPLNTNMTEKGIILLPSGNDVYNYNTTNGEINFALNSDNYVSCTHAVLDYLVVGERDLNDNKSYVRIINDLVGIDVSEEVGTNVVDVAVYQNSAGFGVVSLSEGNFSLPDAKFNILKLGFTGFTENISFDVGRTGSVVVLNENQTKAAVVMNGSHEIHIFDLLKAEKMMTFSSQTTGLSGPRGAEFYGNLLYVTTYGKQVLIFDSNTGEKINSITIDGNSEGLAVEENYIIVTNNQYHRYAPNNRIFAYKHPSISSVSEALHNEQTIRVYPHPVSNDFHLVSNDLAGFNNIAIINSEGKIVATHSGSSNGAVSLNTNALGLVAGNYTAIINGTRAVRFVVIK